MPLLRIMSPTEGHVEMDLMDPRAAAEFDKAMGGQGRFVAYNVATHNGRRVPEPTETFDPTAQVTVHTKDNGEAVTKPVEEVLVVPPMAGGC